VDLDAIPELRPGGWKLYGFADYPLTGTVPKSYLAYGDPFHPATVGYIAKRKKASKKLHVGPVSELECVTEELISSIGRLMPLEVADSRLVRLPVERGSAPDLRFMSRNFIARGVDQLLHGVELVAAYLGSPTEEMNKVFALDDKTQERQFYTVDQLLDVLHWWGRTDAEKRDLQDGFGKMLAFDALVGVQDRHAMNWGGIESIQAPDAPRRFAPLFDTARGLFQDHRESKLEEIDSSGERGAYIAQYAEKSRPVIGCQRPDGHRANHFALIAHSLSEHADALGPPIRLILGAFHIGRVERMLRRKFGRIITKRRVEYILALLEYRRSRLATILRDGT
jgi:hypothetical protein